MIHGPRRQQKYGRGSDFCNLVDSHIFGSNRFGRFSIWELLGQNSPKGILDNPETCDEFMSCDWKNQGHFGQHFGHAMNLWAATTANLW